MTLKQLENAHITTQKRLSTLKSTLHSLSDVDHSDEFHVVVADCLKKIKDAHREASYLSGIMQSTLLRTSVPGYNDISMFRLISEIQSLASRISLLRGIYGDATRSIASDGSDESLGLDSLDEMYAQIEDLEKRHDKLSAVYESAMSKITVVIADDNDRVIPPQMPPTIVTADEDDEVKKDAPVDRDAVQDPNPTTLAHWEHARVVDETYLRTGNRLQCINKCYELGGNHFSPKDIERYLDEKFHSKAGYFDPDNLGNEGID